MKWNVYVNNVAILPKPTDKETAYFICNKLSIAGVACAALKDKE